MGIYSYLVSRYCLRKKITKRMLSILQYKTPFAIEWTTLDENILIIDRLCPLHLLRYALCALYASPRYGDEWKWWFCCCFFTHTFRKWLIMKKKEKRANSPANTDWSALWNRLHAGFNILDMVVVHVNLKYFPELIELKTPEKLTKFEAFISNIFSSW